MSIAVPPVPTGALDLAGLRERAAWLLRPVEDTDPAVIFTADAVTPPSLMVGWDEPWLEPDGNCRFTARLLIIAVAGRLVPETDIATLESMVAYVATRLRADRDYQWGLPTVGAPRILLIAKLNYLGSRVVYTPRVTLQP